VSTAWVATHNATHKSEMPHKHNQKTFSLSYHTYPSLHTNLAPHLLAPYISTLHTHQHSLHSNTLVPVRDGFHLLSTKQETTARLMTLLGYLGSVKLEGSFHTCGFHLLILIMSLKSALISSITNIPPSCKLIFFISEV